MLPIAPPRVKMCRTCIQHQPPPEPTWWVSNGTAGASIGKPVVEPADGSRSHHRSPDDSADPSTAATRHHSAVESNVALPPVQSIVNCTMVFRLKAVAIGGSMGQGYSGCARHCSDLSGQVGSFARHSGWAGDLGRRPTGEPPSLEVPVSPNGDDCSNEDLRDNRFSTTIRPEGPPAIVSSSE